MKTVSIRQLILFSTVPFCLALTTTLAETLEAQQRLPASTASHRRELSESKPATTAAKSTSRPFLISDQIPPVIDRFGVQQGNPAQDKADPSKTDQDQDGEKKDDLDDLDKLLDAPIETLAKTQVAAPDFNLEVTTVSRQKSTIGRSPAAVYVLTKEMIQKSGARTVPDMLRMVPGLQVASYSNNTWVVTSRGFGDLFAKRMLVQVDGRAVFQPTFNGVYWDTVDMLVDDIERIEVIRGPGGSMWGANAVNGIINIITKHAKDTRGFFAEVGGGDEIEGFVGMRVGGQTPAGVNWRLSGKFQEFDQAFHALGWQNDHRQQGRVQFRSDWENGCGDQFTFIAGGYDGISGESFFITSLNTTFNHVNDMSGHHALFRWTRPLGEDSSTTLQVYFDGYTRETLAYNEEVNTLDIDFQHRFKVNDRNKFIWGLGFRQYWDQFQGQALPVLGPVVFANPERGRFDNYSLFFQNETEIEKDRLYFIAGSKVSDNPFTDFEYQPSARMLFLPDDRSAAWAAVSRAVRTPTRLETSLITPAPVGNVFPNPNISSESALTYEMGFRRQPNKFFSYDATVYFTRFEDVVLTTFPPGQITYTNRGEGKSWGAELSTKMQLTNNWDLTAWYSYIDMDITENNPGLTGRIDIFAPHQAFLMSNMRLTEHIDNSLMARYVDNLMNNEADAYLQMDYRLGMKLTSNARFDLVARNLLDPHTTEIRTTTGGGGKITTESQRGIYGVLTIRR